MANVLPMAKRVEVVAHLVEGAGIRPTSRLTSVSQPAILSLLLRVGDGCERLRDRLVRDVDCRTVQVDEIWSYVQKKQARVQPGDSAEVGEAYVFVGMASASKLVISYHVGKRDDENTRAKARQIFRRFLDTTARVEVSPQRVHVRLPRRAHNPMLLESGLLATPVAVPWWGGASLEVAFP